MLKPVLASVLFVMVANANALGIGDLVGGIVSRPSDSGMSVDRVLVRISEIENRRLPQVIDQETRLDKVTADPGQRFTYHYTMLNHRSVEENKAQFNNRLGPALRNQACNEKNLKMFFKNGVKVSYKYRTQDGHDIGEMDISPADCGYKA